MNDFNSKIPSPSISLLQDSGASPIESAKIEFIIPKLTGIRPAATTENTENAANNNATDSAAGPTKIAPVAGAASAVPETVVPLTLEEIKAKLDESIQKNYRRVFIPGRGWVSQRKLQEEANTMQIPATA